MSVKIHEEMAAGGGERMGSDVDSLMMARALEIAARGIGRVSPSPLVGCVIVSPSGAVVGEGYYLYEGVKHAETLALEQAGERARGATAYVSLEPHAHYGRTPPCTDALIEARIARVVASIEDPNPKVAGMGFTYLRSSGVEVETGLLAAEATRLNEAYLHFVRTGLPFVHLKLATSLDGRIATRTGDSRWITGEASRSRVHELRHQYDAVLIGSGTARADDPLLTDRSGRPRRRPLTRVVLDGALTLSEDSKLAATAGEAPVIVYTSDAADPSKSSALIARGVEVVQHESGGRDLLQVLENLAARSLQSVLIEGGATVAGAFLEAGLVDKVSFFIAPLIIGGRTAPAAVGGTGAQRIVDAVRLESTEVARHGEDVEITGVPLRKRTGAT
jgi:diaminohydroxyphosphoribosylaminopyrimidine deaminase/5-amino-6-(5-phosphoribosylamino)uracil reductase